MCKVRNSLGQLLRLPGARPPSQRLLPPHPISRSYRRNPHRSISFGILSVGPSIVVNCDDSVDGSLHSPSWLSYLALASGTLAVLAFLFVVLAFYVRVSIFGNNFVNASRASSKDSRNLYRVSSGLPMACVTLLEVITLSMLEHG